MTEPVTAPLYVAARRVLLDALEALAEHRSAVILAGAQAVYVRTGDAEFDASVAPFTTDADLALDPRLLGPDPRLEQAMQAAGFSLGTEPGIWIASTTAGGQQVEVPVDLLVPASMAGGRRAARLPDHGKNAARLTPGLEAAVADHCEVLVSSLEPAVDDRQLQIPVAGTAAMLVAKAHKLHDRVREGKAKPHRLSRKDAGDVLRLMRADPAGDVGRRLAELADDEMAGPSVRDGVQRLLELFGRRRAPGVELAVEALETALPEDAVRTLSTAYIAVLNDAYETGRPTGEPK